ncbi:hypothetical protein C2142_35355 [Streptomyces sp. CB01881]|nr:hypothetical protein C2142_35355 [Streptomyces sp. CB01881]
MVVICTSAWSAPQAGPGGGLHRGGARVRAGAARKSGPADPVRSWPPGGRPHDVVRRGADGLA